MGTRAPGDLPASGDRGGDQLEVLDEPAAFFCRSAISFSNLVTWPLYMDTDIVPEVIRFGGGQSDLPSSRFRDVRNPEAKQLFPLFATLPCR
jgi:hypothetical protein